MMMMSIESMGGNRFSPLLHAFLYTEKERESKNHHKSNILRLVVVNILYYTLA